MPGLWYIFYKRSRRDVLISSQDWWLGISSLKKEKQKSLEKSQINLERIDISEFFYNCQKKWHKTGDILQDFQTLWCKHIPPKNLAENPISSPVASFCPGCNVVLFQISLSTLVTLHNNYLRSKEVKNILERYSLMREMIKVSVINWKYVHSIGIHVP